jgi:hypothetical protein
MGTAGIIRVKVGVVNVHEDQGDERAPGKRVFL